ncbi:hypothetical protein [Paenibacillus xerothermodurans]|uniref:DUF2802 domain-containing protein n=1 Tax=Paenibacillus xerothermodurans TaxID=1977292 RepID=A0A2W1NXI1_PAEXE|nr:hypothetical protein [Paenibacillus xerothermodurans]PZE22426.1 hypothetical protein CBW46_001180 [Paenibacillus xerothermodurans]
MDQPAWVYIVLMGLALIVAAKILPKSSVSKGQKNPNIDEIEEMMQQFTSELDEQNQAFIQLMAETKKDYEIQLAKLTSRVEMLEQQSGLAVQQLAKLEIAYSALQRQSLRSSDIPAAAFHHQSAESEPAAAREETPAPPAAMSMKLRYSDLFGMRGQGKSIDYIAKKLNMNKGEVNLIIQLAKQEEQMNAK